MNEVYICVLTISATLLSSVDVLIKSNSGSKCNAIPGPWDSTVKRRVRLFTSGTTIFRLLWWSVDNKITRMHLIRWFLSGQTVCTKIGRIKYFDCPKSCDKKWPVTSKNTVYHLSAFCDKISHYCLAFNWRHISKPDQMDRNMESAIE